MNLTELHDELVKNPEFVKAENEHLREEVARLRRAIAYALDVRRMSDRHPTPRLCEIGHILRNALDGKEVDDGA